MAIDQLIDKQDNSEIVRDKIAQILALETANQQVLASNAAKDPDLWKFSVFLERGLPIGNWQKLGDDTEQTDKTPVVNIWYENADVPQNTGDTVHQQRYSGIFNIDCYALGVSSETITGHLPGDSLAALECQRVVKLVRNILMAATYVKLDLRGVVADRWIQSISYFQPRINEQVVQNVIAARISFRVDFNEFSPQITGVDLEELGVKLELNDDGSIFVEADYEYTV